MLLALCPKGDEGLELVDAYLQAAKRIPAGIYMMACERLAETWDDTYTFPRPAHILKAVGLVRAEMREAETARELAEAREEAMTPAQAKELLAQLPQSWEMINEGHIGLKISRQLLERLVARSDTRAIEGGEG